MPCLRQNPVSAGYDSTAPLATRLLMDSHEIPLARYQKIEDLFAVRFRFLRPLDLRHVGGVGSQHFAHGRPRQPQHMCDLAFAHSLRAQFQNRGSLCLAQHVSASCSFPIRSVIRVQFPARVFHLPLRLFLLRASHLRQSFGEPPAGAMQDGDRHLQIALHLFDRRRLGCRRLPLRFQKQFRLGENALADHARAFAPGRVELPGLPRVATMLRRKRRPCACSRRR